MIKIKFLLVIWMIYKTEWWWELRTQTHKMNYVDTSTPSPHFWYRKCTRATNENLNFDMNGSSVFFFSNNSNIKILARRSSFFDPTRHQSYAQKERFHMTSQLPCWCSKPVLWGVVSFLRQTLSFVPINLHRRWSRKWKHFIKQFPFLSLNDTSNLLCCVLNLCCKTCNWKIKI